MITQLCRAIRWEFKRDKYPRPQTAFFIEGMDPDMQCQAQLIASYVFRDPSAISKRLRELEISTHYGSIPSWMPKGAKSGFVLRRANNIAQYHLMRTVNRFRTLTGQ